jgi:nitrile hydratase
MADPEHDHPHEEGEPGGNEIPGYYDMLETAITELLIEKGLITAQEIRRQIEVLDSRTPALGAKVVARAWVDAAFRARLLANGRAACEEFGITFYDETLLIVLENTETVHHLVVCTLCSCYPRPVLARRRPRCRDVEPRYSPTAPPARSASPGLSRMWPATVGRTIP